MSVLNVVRYPHPSLKRTCEAVSTFNTPELKTLADDMLETMKARNGIGLAANQVNIAKRILVAKVPDRRVQKAVWHDQELILVNPTITEKSGNASIQEGCLSFPEVYEQVQRSSKVKVRYQDVSGQTLELEADGLLAICLQHEMDHLDGVTMIDKLSRLKKDMVQRKLKKLGWL